MMIGGIAQPLIFSKQALVFFFWDVTPNMVVSFSFWHDAIHFFPFCNKFGDVIIVQVWMRNFFSKCWYLTENVSDQRSCCQSTRGIDAASYMSETDLAAYLGDGPRLTKVVSVSRSWIQWRQLMGQKKQGEFENHHQLVGWC